MGVYYCDMCGKTLCGESWYCQKCQRAGTDQILCEGCSEIHCASEADKDRGKADDDFSVLHQFLTRGVYTDVDTKFPHERRVRSATVKAILERVVEDPVGVLGILEAADAEADAEAGAEPERKKARSAAAAVPNEAREPDGDGAPPLEPEGLWVLTRSEG